MTNKGCFYACFCYFFGCLSLLLTIYGFLLFADPGFIGGFITAYEYAMEAFYKAIVAPGIVFGVYFIYLGRRAAHQSVRRPLIFAVIALVYLLVTVILVEQFLYFHLDHGQGG